MKNKKKIIITSLVSIFTLLIFLNPNKTQAVPLSPDKYFISVKFGETSNQVLTIPVLPASQGETGGRHFYLSAIGMKKEGEFHERGFYVPDPANLAEPANWIKLDISEFTTVPGQEIKVNWTVTPTEFAGCGTNLAAIVASDKPIDLDNPGAVINIGANIYSQVHLDILSTNKGLCDKNKADLNLFEFKIKQDKLNKYDTKDKSCLNTKDKSFKQEKCRQTSKGFKFLGTTFFNYDAVPFITIVENKGNLISRRPKGFIEIGKNLDKINVKNKIVIPVNQEEGGYDIYPKTSRRFENTYWFDNNYPRNKGFFNKFWYELTNWKFGKYEARLGLTVNVDQPIVAKQYFWIFPWRVILVFTVLIIIILFALYKAFFRKKEYGDKKPGALKKAWLKASNK